MDKDEKQAFKVALWCRHEGDNIIGIDGKTPWHIPEDLGFFKRLTIGSNVVCGRKTYESFPNRTLSDRRIFILTRDKEYQVADKEKHIVVNDIRFFDDFEEDLYIVGGAEIYSLFMKNNTPEIIVDNICNVPLNKGQGKTITDITEIVAQMEKKYKRLLPPFEKKDFSINIRLKKGEFVDKKILRHILECCN